MELPELDDPAILGMYITINMWYNIYFLVLYKATFVLAGWTSHKIFTLNGLITNSKLCEQRPVVTNCLATVVQRYICDLEVYLWAWGIFLWPIFQWPCRGKVNCDQLLGENPLGRPQWNILSCEHVKIQSNYPVSTM